MSDISFNIACKELKIAQIAQLNQLFQLLHLVHIYGHGFYELSRMLMRKNVDNDVSKDSPFPKDFLQEQNNSFPPLRANENGINNIDDVEYFLKLSGDKLPVLNDGRLKFIFSNDSYDICCVYVTMAPHYLDFDFKLTSDAKIQPVF